jgi:trimeric autotransporter adhesin
MSWFVSRCFVHRVCGLLLPLLLVVACGGGDGAADRVVSAPAAPAADRATAAAVAAGPESLMLRAEPHGIKSLRLSWPGSADPSVVYTVLQRTEADGPFQLFASGLHNNSLVVRLPLHLIDWRHHEYRVMACGNSAGCSIYYGGQLLDLVAAMTGYLKASNTGRYDQFGAAVALSADGNTLAVGAPDESSNGQGVNPKIKDNDQANDSGAVYVFVRDGATWTQRAYVKAIDPKADAAFGRSVALAADGSTLAVGADRYSRSWGSRCGAVYVFSRSGGTWSQQFRLEASDSSRRDQFGGQVALSADGNTLAVGSMLEESAATGVNGNEYDDSAFEAGAVYRRASS